MCDPPRVHEYYHVQFLILLTDQIPFLNGLEVGRWGTLRHQVVEREETRLSLNNQFYLFYLQLASSLLSQRESGEVKENENGEIAVDFYQRQTVYRHVHVRCFYHQSEAPVTTCQAGTPRLSGTE